MWRDACHRKMLWTVAVCAAVTALAAGCASAGAMAGPAPLHSAFPSARAIREMTPEPGPHGNARVYVVEGRSATLGYGVKKQVVSRSGAFTILVIADADFRVEGVEVLSYLGERGREVQSARFRQQFVGKGLRDPIRLGDDIDAETGATLSSNAVARGVRDALRLLAKGLGPAQRP